MVPEIPKQDCEEGVYFTYGLRIWPLRPRGYGTRSIIREEFHGSKEWKRRKPPNPLEKGEPDPLSLEDVMRFGIILV